MDKAESGDVLEASTEALGSVLKVAGCHWQV